MIRLPVDYDNFQPLGPLLAYYHTLVSCDSPYRRQKSSERMPVTVTSFNPLPAHLQAVQEELSNNGGMNTPTNGGTVMTGQEWDYVTGKDAQRR